MFPKESNVKARVASVTEAKRENGGSANLGDGGDDGDVFEASMKNEEEEEEDGVVVCDDDDEISE